MDKVSQNTDLQTGKARIAINEEEATLLEELRQDGTNVNGQISNGWLKTEGFGFGTANLPPIR